MRKFLSRISVFVLGILIAVAATVTLEKGGIVPNAYAAQKKHRFKKITLAKIYTEKDSGYDNRLSLTDDDSDYLIMGLSISCDKDSKLKISAKGRKTLVIDRRRDVDKYWDDEDEYQHFLFLEEEGFQPGDAVTVRAYHKTNGVYDAVPYAAKIYHFAGLKTISKSQANKYYHYFRRKISQMSISEDDPDLPGCEFGKFHQFYDGFEWRALKGHRVVGISDGKADKIIGPVYKSEFKGFLRRYNKYYKVTYTNDGRQPTYHSKELKRGMWYSASRYKPLCVYTYQRKTKRLIGVGYYGLKVNTYSARLK